MGPFLTGISINKYMWYMTNMVYICFEIECVLNVYWKIKHRLIKYLDFSIAIFDIYIYTYYIYTGWWLTYLSEKCEFVNGKDDIPYMKWKIKDVPNHQPVCIYLITKGPVFFWYHQSNLGISGLFLIYLSRTLPSNGLTFYREHVRLKLVRISTCSYGFVWKCWVYSQWNSHLIGMMTSKTIGFRGLAYFQTHPYSNIFLSCSCKNMMYPKCRMKVLMFCRLPSQVHTRAFLPHFWTLVEKWDRGGHLPVILQISLISAWIHQKWYVAVKRFALLFFFRAGHWASICSPIEVS